MFTKNIRKLIRGTGFIGLGLIVFSLGAQAKAEPPRDDVVKYARFQTGETVAYGIVEGERIREIEGDLFGDWTETDRTYSLDSVELLVPTEPKQVFAMAGNYRSHIGEGVVTTTITTETTVVTDPETGETTTDSSTDIQTRSGDEIPELFQVPQPFLKTISSLTAHETPIIIPDGSEEVHYEAEMVVVIGKKARDVPEDEAMAYVFGVTCGNDVSARVWQQNDVQWWRAKGSDTFGPCGPYIVSGLNYDDLLMQLRLNGEVKQKERTSQMIHDVATTVSAISQEVTLHPGDLIFTGTTGTTGPMAPGDVVEVEIEGVGVLRNSVIADE